MLSNISYRYKIPASLSLVIVVTALAVAAPLISGAKQTTKRDLIDHALSLGKTLAGAVQPALLHDDMWQAYEIITTPYDRALQQRLGQPTIVVVDALGAIYVASDPKRFPATHQLASLGAMSSRLAEIISRPIHSPMVLGGPRPEALDHGRARAIQRQHAAWHGHTRVFPGYLQPTRPGDHSQGRCLNRDYAGDPGAAGLALGKADCQPAMCASRLPSARSRVRPPRSWHSRRRRETMKSPSSARHSTIWSTACVSARRSRKRSWRPSVSLRSAGSRRGLRTKSTIRLVEC